MAIGGAATTMTFTPPAAARRKINYKSKSKEIEQ